MKAQITFKDGVKITTKRTNGKYDAMIDYPKGGTEYVFATYPTLLKAKVGVAIKEHWSNVIKGLAEIARRINANALRRR